MTISSSSPPLRAEALDEDKDGGRGDRQNDQPGRDLAFSHPCAPSPARIAPGTRCDPILDVERALGRVLQPPDRLLGLDQRLQAGLRAGVELELDAEELELGDLAERIPLGPCGRASCSVRLATRSSAARDFRTAERQSSTAASSSPMTWD